MKGIFGTVALLLALGVAGCGRSGGDSNLGVASGNTLSQEQIDAALGPANQQAQASGNAVVGPENATVAANATGNEARPSRRHRIGNAAQGTQ